MQSMYNESVITALTDSVSSVNDSTANLEFVSCYHLDFLSDECFCIFQDSVSKMFFSCLFSQLYDASAIYCHSISAPFSTLANVMRHAADVLDVSE